jgi:hypothetical protein
MDADFLVAGWTPEVVWRQPSCLLVALVVASMPIRREGAAHLGEGTLIG